MQSRVLDAYVSILSYIIRHEEIEVLLNENYLRANEFLAVSLLVCGTITMSEYKMNKVDGIINNMYNNIDLLTWNVIVTKRVFFSPMLDSCSSLEDLCVMFASIEILRK